MAMKVAVVVTNDLSQFRVLIFVGFCHRSTSAGATCMSSNRSRAQLCSPLADRMNQSFLVFDTALMGGAFPRS